MGTWDNLADFFAGHVPTADEFATWRAVLLGILDEQPAFKNADTTYAVSSTTMQNDPDLFAPMGANGIYQFGGLIGYAANATPQIKVGLTVPSGATLKWVSNALDASVTAAASGIVDKTLRAGSTPTLGVNGVANNLAFPLYGTVIMGSTAGNLQFQAAQAVSNAVAPLIKNGSILILKRVG